MERKKGCGMIAFTLSFNGNDAENHELDFYDVAQAMIGFQRSLAITTHLVMNGKVITKAPFLKNARINAVPPKEGSWEISAIITVLVTAGYKLGTAPKDTPIGHLVRSAYDYVISESLGFRVDYDKTLGQQYEQIKKGSSNDIPILEQSQLDSVIEKCDFAIKEMHRPIVKSETASSARIIYKTDKKESPLKCLLDRDSFEYLKDTTKDEEPVNITGRVSSYNINTYKGRIFVADEKRPLPFQLADTAQSPSSVGKITRSLSMNAVDRFVEGANISCMAFKNRSRTGRLKSYYILDIE
jgi:hypothetical protein